MLLFLWTILYAYLLGYTKPPILAAVLLFLPFVALGWTVSASGRPVAWEVDEVGFWRSRGKTRRLLVEWPRVTELLAHGRPGSPNAALVLRVKAPASTIRIVAGAGISLDALRTLYEASAFHLRRYGVRIQNPFGWSDTLPLVATKVTRGPKVDWAFHIGASLVLGGLVLLPGAVGQSVMETAIALATSILGGVVLVLSRVRARKHVPPPEPGYRVNE